MIVGSHVDRFEILGDLGAGGMGRLYRARDPRLGREVAIKVLSERLDRSREFHHRFAQEARSASALNHPNIVTIYEVGEPDGYPFIAMELVEGRSLRFSPANARTPQPVRLHAVADADERSEQARFTLALTGTLVRETVTARVLDAAGPSFGDGGLLEDDPGVGDAGLAGNGVLAEDDAGCGCRTGRDGRPTGLGLLGLVGVLGGCGLAARQRARTRRPR